MSDEMTKAEFVDRLTNPNKDKVLGVLEDLVEEYSSMIAHVTYVTYSRGTHYLMLVFKDGMKGLLFTEFLIEMNKAMPGCEVTNPSPFKDADTDYSTYIVQVIE